MGVDSLLQKTVKELIVGHRYWNIRIKGQAHTGDAYCSDCSGGAVGASHRYDGINAKEGGKALVVFSHNAHRFLSYCRFGITDWRTIRGCK